MDTVSTTLTPDAPMSEPARILNTFIAPSKTFSDLSRNASWWGPYLLLALATFFFVMTMDRQIGFEQISKNEIAKSSRAEQFDKLPADQKAQQMHMTVAITRNISYATPVLALIAYLIMAGVLMGVFNFGAGTSVPFKVALAITVYGSLPWIIHAALGIASMMAGVDKDGFDVKNPLGSNPAYFMDATGNKFLYGMASAFDIFAIWSVVLIGIGFACNSKVKKSTAIMIVAGMLLFYKLVGSSLSAMFG